MVRFAPVLALVALVLASATSAAPSRFAVHADLRPAGCRQTIAGTLVTLAGCVARARFSGTASGSLDIAYSARVDLARGSGSQRGTMTLRTASGADRLVLRFTGTVSVDGRSHGTWSAVSRSGSFGAAPTTGAYSSATPDQGVHVSFDVRG